MKGLQSSSIEKLIICTVGAEASAGTFTPKHSFHRPVNTIHDENIDRPTRSWQGIIKPRDRLHDRGVHRQVEKVETIHRLSPHGQLTMPLPYRAFGPEPYMQQHNYRDLLLSTGSQVNYDLQADNHRELQQLDDQTAKLELLHHGPIIRILELASPSWFDQDGRKNMILSHSIRETAGCSII